MIAKVMDKLSKLKTGDGGKKQLFTMFLSRCSVHKYCDYPLKLD